LGRGETCGRGRGGGAQEALPKVEEGAQEALPEVKEEEAMPTAQWPDVWRSKIAVERWARRREAREGWS